MINKMRENLEMLGYTVKIVDDYCIEVRFIDYDARFYETLEEKIVVKMFKADTEEVVEKRTYKTTKGAIKFMNKILWKDLV